MSSSTHLPTAQPQSAPETSPRKGPKYWPFIILGVVALFIVVVIAYVLICASLDAVCITVLMIVTDRTTN